MQTHQKPNCHLISLPIISAANFSGSFTTKAVPSLLHVAMEGSQLSIIWYVSVKEFAKRKTADEQNGNVAILNRVHHTILANANLLRKKIGAFSDVSFFLPPLAWRRFVGCCDCVEWTTMLDIKCICIVVVVVVVCLLLSLPQNYYAITVP